MPGTGRRWRSAFNADIDALYFEGDFSSLFAGLDPGGMKPIDYGFSIGRQAFVVQNGILLNDTLDAVGIVRNNLRPAGTSNLRLTGVWAWNGVDRNDGRVDPETDLFGLFASADLPIATLEVDALRVTDRRPDGNGWYLGAAAIQRFGAIATTFRANASFADGPDTAQIGDGVLLSAEVTWTLPGSDDLVYINPFLAEETFTQAGRDPLAGGPLAALGILFAGSGMGNWRAPLSASARDVIGAALGYQMFWDRARRNLVLEVAGRRATGGGNDDAALGLRFQQKVEERILLQVDGFYAVQEGRDDAHGGRTEVLVQF
jgi:hypothetical protein